MAPISTAEPQPGANVVLDDADLSEVMPHALQWAVINSGQTCSALTRLVVPRDKLAEVTTDMEIHREEVFGPVLAIQPYDDEEDAVRIANDSVYGLAGAVWSKDPARARAVANRLRTGQIMINGGEFNPNAPFGGYKQSGIGREFGTDGLEEFLEIKALQY